MMLTVGILVCVILFATGIPLYIVFGLGGVAILLFSIGFPLSQTASLLFDALNSFVLLAAGLFILSGYLMSYTGLAEPLVALLKGATNRVPGGLAVAAIIACCAVGALTGSAPATMAAVGITMFPAMNAKGYDRGFSAAVLGSASNLGHYIPPSLPFILLGYLTGASIPKLFLAGIIPGLILTVLLSATAIIIIWRKKIPLDPAVGWRDFGRLFIRALPAIFMPVIVLGGMYGGIFTPTEAAAVGCVYCIIVGILLKRRAVWQSIMTSLTETARLVSMVMLLVAGAVLLGKGFILVGFPQALTSFIVNAGLGPLGFILLLSLLIFILGFIMDAVVIMFVVIPIILPAAIMLHIDLLYLAVVFLSGTSVAILTPPVASHLYITAGIFDVPVSEVFKGILPFLVVLCLFWLLIIPFPWLSTWLPSIVSGG
jgi:C4-dicarboxylate transporter DctM subunit